MTTDRFKERYRNGGRKIHARQRRSRRSSLVCTAA